MDRSAYLSSGSHSVRFLKPFSRQVVAGLLVLATQSACGPSSAADDDRRPDGPAGDRLSVVATAPASPGTGGAGHSHTAPQGPVVATLTRVRGDGLRPETRRELDGEQPRGEAGEQGRVLSLTGALTLQIDTTGGPLEVRLAEIDTPVPDQARSRMEAWLVGRTASLVYSGLRRDRYERALAHVLIGPALPDPARAGEVPGEAASSEPGLWLQAHLVREGLARVMTHADNQAHAGQLLALEDRARADRVGMWADPAYAVRDPHPDARAQDVGSAQLVEGRVVDAVQLENGRIYLNFGADYRTDFTVRIDAADSAGFIEAGLGPEALLDRRIRVRGWLVDENGPLMRLDHPARLEVLAEDPRDALPR